MFLPCERCRGASHPGAGLAAGLECGPYCWTCAMELVVLREARESEEAEALTPATLIKIPKEPTELAPEFIKDCSCKAA